MISHGGALSFSPSPRHLQPPLKTATANNLSIYLLCRMEGDGLRGGEEAALGRGRGRVPGAICLFLSAPCPAGKWWTLLVTWPGELFIRARGPGEAECPPASRAGRPPPQRAERLLCSPLALFPPRVAARACLLKRVPSLGTFQGRPVRRAVSIWGSSTESSEPGTCSPGRRPQRREEG